MVGLVDQYGKPLEGTREHRLRESQHEVFKLRGQISSMLKGRYDAAQTHSGNERHWANADHLDPTSANSYGVRRKLRSRSRYEVIENNPYLKGCVLTIANDFIGNGPKLQITDTRLSKQQRTDIENRVHEWMSAVGFRQKLWRARMAKLVDGESFMFAFTNDRRKPTYADEPVSLDFMVIETDQVTDTQKYGYKPSDKYNEVDGLRWDNYGNPIAYHLLDHHPGNDYTFPNSMYEGKWIKAKNCIQWFRQDRGWMRGIPELTPSLPLCAMLRRYTLAVVRAAEIAAEFAAILETEGPPNTNAWTDGNGNTLSDDPFDMFPIEMGMFVTMPWGYKMKQLEAKQPMQMYDVFVNALLREITRPILIPFNLSAGTSKDSNMASGVLDTHIYKGGQNQEHISCEEEVLEPALALYMQEATRVPGLLPRKVRSLGRLKHTWRWDQIGLEHTDPEKVMNALKIAHDKGFLTDRDIQETRYNRNVEDWRKDYEEDLQFRNKNENMGMRDAMPPPSPEDQGANAPQPNAKKPKTKTAKK